MISVSEAWEKKQRERLAPEGFVELSYLISENGLQEDATAASNDQTVFSDLDSITVPSGDRVYPRFATMELNQWILDGSAEILPDNGPYENAGYVSSSFCDDGDPSLTINLSQIHTQVIQGITILWSTEYEEYPTRFRVSAYRGGSLNGSITVEGNQSTTSTVYMDIQNYDSVVIQALDWCLPSRRARIEQVVLGLYVTYTKGDLISFSHEQSGCLVSGELPKNAITFALDNSTGVWNPLNPDGNVKYLAERQQIKVRYGFDIDGSIEWIKAGTFYLSEWSTPANGLTATFTARDMLEFAIDVPYTGIRSGTLYDIVSAAIAETELPLGAQVYIDPYLRSFQTDFSANEQEFTLAEILQMAANAGTCVIHQDREGVLRIERISSPLSGYDIGENVSYAYPEVSLSKPLKAVATSYGENAVVIRSVGSSGETQTVDNPLITNLVTARNVADWVSMVLSERQTITGQYRADPRLDICDKVAVDSKYGVSNAVIITNIKYEFTGSFKGTFTGRVSKFDPVPAAYSGERYAGELLWI